jgi:hypothetical protein
MQKISFIKSIVTALSIALLLAASDARASFTYSVTATPLTQPFGTSSVYTITPSFPPPATSTPLSGTQLINLVQTSQTTGTVIGTDTTTIPVSITTTINNLNGGGSGNIVVAGNINVTRSDVFGAISSFTLTSILPASITLDGFTYALSAPTYTAPTVQGGANSNGGISIMISETANAVPEPASMVMLGTSILAIGGISALRRRRQA